MRHKRVVVTQYAGPEVITDIEEDGRRHAVLGRSTTTRSIV